MRSIHKKTLKRFLSTLLALTMVLGMVPFTALAAAPAPVTLTQSDLTATIAPSEPAPATATVPATVTYTVEIAASAGFVTNTAVKLTIDSTDYDFGAVTVDGSNQITGATVPSGFEDYAITAGKITGTVTKNYAPNSYNVPMSLTVGGGTSNGSATFTVPRAADLSLTVPSSAVTAGQDFTVTATSDIADGRVLFEYNGESKYVDVESRLSSGKTIGYAECTFAAVDGKTNVKATQFDMTGVVNTEDADTIIVTAAPVVYTVTFEPGATGVYALPSNTTYTGTYNITTDQPSRDGYTFTAWSDGVKFYKYDSGWEVADTIDGPYLAFTGFSGTNVTLTAQWTKNTVAVTWPTILPNGVGAITTLADATLVGGTTTAPEGSTVTFKVTVTDGYDGSAMVVTANGSPLYGTKGTGNTYTYTFTATANPTKIEVAAAPTLIPTYYNVVFNPGCAAAVGNMPADGKVEEGQTYTIPVQAPVRTDYEFQGWATTYGGAVVYAWDGSAFTTPATPPVNADMTLYAVWAPVQVNVKYLEANTADIAGIKTFGVKIGATTLIEGASGNSVAKNSTVTITIELEDGYDPSTLEVLAGDKPLYGLLSGGKYIYEFKAEQNTEIKISESLAKKQFTITLPQGDGYATEFVGCTPAAANGKTSHTFNYGEKFKVMLTVQPDIKATLKIDGETAAEINAGATVQTATSGEVVVTKEHNVSVAIEKKIIRTVTYSLEPHSGLYTTQLVENNTTATKPADPEIRGYDFDGKWYTKPNYSAEWDFSTKVTADMILYGKLTAKTNTISYAENKPTGAGTVSGMPAGTTKTYGQSVQLAAATPTLNGYDFMGWATSATGPVAYQPGETFITELDADITLYAVWQIKTYTVTMPAGTGYSVTPSGVNTVEWMSDFTFTLTVDRQYAATEPVVKVNGAALPETSGAVSNDSAASWTYTIEDITENKTVEISVTKNAVHTVKFYVSKNGAAESEPFLTQSVEHGYYATMPAAPDVEGYVFKNVFYTTAGGPTKFPFDTIVTGDMDAFAYYEAITPQVFLPADGTGWTITFDSVTNIPGSQTGDYAYGADAEFVITVQPGYDMTNIKVSVNDNLWAYTNKTVAGDGTVTLEYIIHNLTEEVYNVRVTDIERKTVTITYDENADDHVAQMPGQQVINQYIETAPASDSNETITTQIPTRVGYEFKGWSTKSDLVLTDYDESKFTAEYHYYAKGDANAENTILCTLSGKVGVISRETKDTTLYAIWKADTTSITLDVSDVAVDAAAPANAKEYEGQKVTLTATLDTAVSTGSVIFYQNDQVISSQNANGSTTYTFEATTGAYSGTDTYKAAYKAESAEGYGSSNSNEVSVDRLSTTITWKLAAGAVVTDGDKLIVYKGTEIVDANKVATGIMEANNVYTLVIPDVYDVNGVKLTVGTDYAVEWIYKDEKGVETKYTKDVNGDSAVISAEFSKYQFKAVVTPVKDATRSVYNKAAGYNSGVLADDDAPALYTQWTVAVAREKTETALAIEGAVNENQKITIDGTEVDFGAAHWAQFEGDKLVLKASVTIEGETTPVSAGYVDFYRYNADDTWTKLNADPVAVDENTGIATFGDDYNEAVLVKAYVDGTGSNADEAKDNVDKFFAVYLANATWETSASTDVTYTSGAIATVDAPVGDDVVYVKSTTIKTPVIDVKRGATEKGNTTYTADLTGLIAGVEYTLTLRETGASTSVASNWSVVALDGRTVAKTDYTIQWYTGTPTTDPAKVDLTMGTGATYSVENPAKDDYFYVELTAQNNMDKGEKSNKVIIDAKQDVNVSVVASDEIKSTAETDVYQLNMITLTATVTAKEVDAAEQPTDGLVGFYYQPYSGAKWVKIGESKALTTEDGKTFAEIETDVLPVDAAKNTKQTVKVLAVYEGNDTFNASHEVASDNSVSQKTTGTVEIEKVTVYSSVVFVDTAEENKKVSTNNGIIISANGALKANNADVTLTLSDIYTLDHATEDHTTTPDLSKLTFGTDYTVQWWKLENANACKDPGTTDSYALTSEWEKINGATNINYTIDMVPQNVAYRAEITVTGTPITKGSDTEVVQAVAGRRVYYSNVLVVGDGMLTVTTNITTSDNKAFNEEGIVKGETVTIHTLVAGATGSAPVCNVVATVEPEGNTDPTKIVTITADGGSYTSNGYCALTWNTAAEDVTPGYYTLKVTATSNNGYESQDITRTLIVRDNQYTLTVTDDSKVYNGKAQGIDWSLIGVDIEDTLAQNSVVVYYKQGDKLVEPTQAGKYTYELYLPASAYWTELTHVTGEFTITPRPVNVVDLVAQAKVYDGTTDINELEVILNDSAIDGDGAATSDTGIINGDSIYATGVMTIDAAGAGNRTLSVSNVTLHGDDVKNYVVGSTSYTESINVQRSQVKGDIANSTYKYTGSNITVPASDIYLIDQAGNKLSNYTVTYYYHNGDGVEKVDAMNKLGKYTVIARPEQDNYKGGASQTVYVAATADDQAPDTTAKSALINITNTVELFGATTGIKASATNGATIKKIEYQNGTGWIETAPTAAGRYLVKVTASTGDTAYGIYTIVKARPELTLTATGAEYTSAQISGTPTGTFNVAAFPAGTYYTYTGGTIKGVSYTAPTDAGNYVVTAHVGETDNFTAHEVSANFTIAKAPLTIDADELVRMQYESYPDMVATFKGLVGSVEAPDTSLRDVQIQPEFIFNEVNGGYTNAALDQVGADYPITVRNALSRNYEITYVGGNMAVNAQDANADLAIHGMIDNANGGDIAYYGDVIQLYAYGNYGDSVEGTGKRHNTSSLIKWSVNCSDTLAEIDSQDGLLKINGVGTFTVTLTRGSGTAAISTSIEIEALKKEVKVDVKDQDKVYTAGEQTYDGTVTVEGLINGDTDSATLVAGDKRTNVGSQIVTYKVNTTKYVSETYGGLFTINDKEVTVKPDAASVVYGEALGTLTYSETGTVGGVNALTNGKAVSIRDSYVNLDVLDGYEILVAGVENMNYNVKYETKDNTNAATIGDVKVNALALDVSTGTLDDNVGMTSGSLNPAGKFPVNGAVVDPAVALSGKNNNVRMYGEPNWVMDYDVWTAPNKLISGDSLADLDLDLEGAPLGSTLVDFNYTIAANANITYPTRTSTTPTYIGSLTAYPVDTDDSMIAFGNYDETYYEGTQNIYQRPVTLSVRPDVNLTAYKPSIIDDSNNVKQDVLKQLLLNNLVVGEYNGKGGLATLLGHTIEDLDIQIDTVSYSGDTITVTIKLGNTNYWTENLNFTVKVDPSKIVANYGPLGWTSATVTMTGVDEHGNTTGPVDVSGTVTYLIYAKDTTVTEHKYSHYKNLTPVRSVTMTYGGSTGYYIANYDRLSAGDYVMFAIAEGYTIIE